MNLKAQKVIEKLYIKKKFPLIPYLFWAKKTLDQGPESRIRNLDPHKDETLDLRITRIRNTAEKLSLVF